MGVWQWIDGRFHAWHCSLPIPQVLEQDFERRLDELRGSLRREAEHAKQSTEHAMLHMRRTHEVIWRGWESMGRCEVGKQNEEQ